MYLIRETVKFRKEFKSRPKKALFLFIIFLGLPCKYEEYWAEYQNIISRVHNFF